jgi:NAD(P)-dependent dehydrogenase (short-subunit alcohol dehydrogenase family)
VSRGSRSGAGSSAISGKSVLVVGAGKMSTLAARHLYTSGAQRIIVTNRSPEKAEALAAEIDGIARPWADLEAHLVQADVVISSTGAREPILTRPLFKRVTKARRWRQLVVIDIAVPRDAEPAIGEFDGVYVFDIDDLEKVVAANLAERARAAEHAARIVEHEAGQFEARLRPRPWSRRSAPARALRARRRGRGSERLLDPLAPQGPLCRADPRGGAAPGPARRQQAPPQPTDGARRGDAGKGGMRPGSCASVSTSAPVDSTEGAERRNADQRTEAPAARAQGRRRDEGSRRPIANVIATRALASVAGRHVRRGSRRRSPAVASPSTIRPRAT